MANQPLRAHVWSPPVEGLQPPATDFEVTSTALPDAAYLLWATYDAESGEHQTLVLPPDPEDFEQTAYMLPRIDDPLALDDDATLPGSGSWGTPSWESAIWPTVANDRQPEPPNAPASTPAEPAERPRSTALHLCIAALTVASSFLVGAFATAQGNVVTRPVPLLSRSEASSTPPPLATVSPIPSQSPSPAVASAAPTLAWFTNTRAPSTPAVTWMSGVSPRSLSQKLHKQFAAPPKLHTW